MSSSSHPQQRGGVEDVGADHLPRPQREENEKRESEEDPGSDGCEAHDQPAEEADCESGHAVTPLESEVSGMFATAHEVLAHQPDSADQESSAEHGGTDRLASAAIPVLQ